MEYPREAWKAKVEGKVFVSIVIDKEVNLIQDSVKVHKGLGYGLDEEAVRIMRLSPRWKPGHVTELNRDAPMKIIFPITFKR